jgi:hypothetical protein
MLQHVKHMTDNSCATEGGWAFSRRIDIRLRPRLAVMPPYSMTMVATNVEGTITSLAMRYHTMAPTVSPPTIQLWTFECRCSKALVDCRSEHLYHNSDRCQSR